MSNDTGFKNQVSIFDRSYDGFVFNLLEKKEVLFKEFFDEDDDEDEDDDDFIIQSTLGYREYALLKIANTKKMICLNNSVLYPPK